MDLFAQQDGIEGRMDWSSNEQFLKLKEFADSCLATINGEDAAEEDEYYDEEDGGEEAKEW